MEIFNNISKICFLVSIATLIFGLCIAPILYGIVYAISIAFKLKKVYLFLSCDFTFGDIIAVLCYIALAFLSLTVFVQIFGLLYSIHMLLVIPLIAIVVIVIRAVIVSMKEWWEDD